MLKVTQRLGKKSGPCRAPVNDIEPWVCLASLDQVNMVFWYGQMSDHSSHLTEAIQTLGVWGPLLALGRVEAPPELFVVP